MTNQIYLSQPINRTAGLVTNQKATEDTQSLTDKKDCLVRRLHQLIEQNEMVKAQGKTKEERRFITEQINQINAQIANIKKHLQGERGIDQYILDICRQHFTEDQWNRIMHRTYAAMADAAGDKS